MGKEAHCECRWQDETGAVRLHLDSAELTLRGDLRAAIPRAEIKGASLTDQGLLVETAQGNIDIFCTAKQAQSWQKALLKAPPSLAEKLGLSAAKQAFVIGQVADPALVSALTGHKAATLEKAQIIVAVLKDETDLRQAATQAKAVPDKHIWMIYPKGKAAAIGATAIRQFMRDSGFIDSKSCAVSDQLTATRFRLRDR